MFTPIKTLAIALSVATATVAIATSPQTADDCTQCRRSDNSQPADSVGASPLREVFVTKDNGSIWAALRSTEVPPLRTISDNALANLASCIAMIGEARGAFDIFPAALSQLYIAQINPADTPDDFTLAIHGDTMALKTLCLTPKTADLATKELINKRMMIAVDSIGNPGVVTAIEFIPDSGFNIPIQLRLRVPDPDPGRRRITLDFNTFASNYPKIIFIR